MEDRPTTPESEKQLHSTPVEIRDPNNRIYTDIQALAHTGQSQSFRGFDPHLSSYVFLKITPDSRLNVSSEAVAVAALKHPNIVPVLDRFPTTIDGQDVHVAVSDFISGVNMHTLMNEIKNGGVDMPISTRVSLLKPIASAIDYANKRGILHRDIKPANILVNKTTPYLTDFGASNAVQNTGSHVIGTVGYMSPEQIWGKDQPGDSEEWALAALSYQFLTGVELLDEIDPSIKTEGNKEEIAEKRYQANLSTDGLPEQAMETLKEVFGEKAPLVRDIYDKALKKDKTARFRSASEFIDTLQSVL